MDIVQVIQLLTNAPLSLVLLYLLIRAQQETAEIRKGRDEDARQWIERFATLAERVAQAVERLDLPGPH